MRFVYRPVREQHNDFGTQQEVVVPARSNNAFSDFWLILMGHGGGGPDGIELDKLYIPAN